MPPSLPTPLPDFLEHADDDVRVAGHRITLYHVLSEYNQGESPEGITLRFPTLKLSTVHKIIAFYLDHQPAIDDYLRHYASDLQEQEARTPAISKAELLRRLEDIRLKAHHAAQVPD